MTDRKVRADEREMCARIAESFSYDYGAEVGKMAKRIAEVIRRRSRLDADEHKGSSDRAAALEQARRMRGGET